MSKGVVLGKFMPVHNGHRYLIDFARHYCDELTILIGSLPGEPIPGELRVAWLRELFPNQRVVHITDENPQLPHEHPDFWAIWRRSLERALGGEQPDFLFASEEYGQRLAEELGATFVATSGWREIVPVSATQIREDPAAYWDHIPSCVRPHFVKKICLFGPESTGKTTLARALAEHYQTVAVPEYARGFLECKGAFEASDLEAIGRGQLASEQALARRARHLLFCDTDLLTTRIWGRWLLNTTNPWLESMLDEAAYDLTLLTDVDLAWQPDAVRYLPHQGPAFLDCCIQELEKHNRPYVMIRGAGEERFAAALAAVEEWLRDASKQRRSG
ncbi:MAG: AAA family ATPase [Vulcanimicrobiota bacterium]